ncbi:hypothetical protein V6N12_047280 [Hibiscus sabdariffa]|uniref:Uncharacterized protein n=1 Tax=Hibiscus sabdariffa TaxID=183260 RepID=A0ABR2DAE3_9ROSI
MVQNSSDLKWLNQQAPQSVIHVSFAVSQSSTPPSSKSSHLGSNSQADHPFRFKQWRPFLVLALLRGPVLQPKLYNEKYKATSMALRETVMNSIREAGGSNRNMKDFVDWLNEFSGLESGFG